MRVPSETDSASRFSAILNSNLSDSDKVSLLKVVISSERESMLKDLTLMRHIISCLIIQQGSSAIKLNGMALKSYSAKVKETGPPVIEYTEDGDDNLVSVVWPT